MNIEKDWSNHVGRDFSTLMAVGNQHYQSLFSKLLTMCVEFPCSCLCLCICICHSLIIICLFSPLCVFPCRLFTLCVAFPCQSFPPLYLVPSTRFLLTKPVPCLCLFCICICVCLCTFLCICLCHVNHTPALSCPQHPLSSNPVSSNLFLSLSLSLPLSLSFRCLF